MFYFIKFGKYIFCFNSVFFCFVYLFMSFLGLVVWVRCGCCRYIWIFGRGIGERGEVEEYIGMLLCLCSYYNFIFIMLSMVVEEFYDVLFYGLELSVLVLVFRLWLFVYVNLWEWVFCICIFFVLFRSMEFFFFLKCNR